MEIYMRINNFNSTESTKNKHGITTKKLYDTENALIMHLMLKPGEKLKPHITPVDVAFYILEGNPDIMVGQEIRPAAQDDLIESPKNIVHCIYNNSTTTARVLVMKFPKPTKPTVFVEEV